MDGDKFYGRVYLVTCDSVTFPIGKYSRGREFYDLYLSAKELNSSYFIRNWGVTPYNYNASINSYDHKEIMGNIGKEIIVKKEFLPFVVYKRNGGWAIPFHSEFLPDTDTSLHLTIEFVTKRGLVCLSRQENNKRYQYTLPPIYVLTALKNKNTTEV